MKVFKSFKDLEDMLNYIGQTKENVSIFYGKGIGASRPSQGNARIGWILGFLFGFIGLIVIIAVAWIILPILLALIVLYWFYNKSKGFKSKGHLLILTPDAIHLFTKAMFNDVGNMRSLVYKKMLFDAKQSNIVPSPRSHTENVLAEKLIKEEFFVYGIRIEVATFAKAAIVNWDDFKSLDINEFIEEIKKIAK